MFAETVYFLRKNSINLSTFFRERQRYPYSKMCNVCNVCNALSLCASLFLWKRYCTVCNALSLCASLFLWKQRSVTALFVAQLDYLIYTQQWPRDYAKSLLTKTLLLQSRATSWASRRGLRGLETRLLWFAMRLLSYLSLPWYKEQNRYVGFYFYEQN